MSRQRTPQEMLELLMQKDVFSRWMGLQHIEVDKGYTRFTYTIIPEMMNGLGTVHGGVLFSAADSALAFASNSHDDLSVALEVSISYTRAARLGDVLTVEAKEIYSGRRTGVYDIRTYNQDNELVCAFKGTVYKTGKRINLPG
ncbi:MAG: PaaI family thioesterase [Taibaiella sp.]|nr:PaaI family thioesterase [Taibaiella sp.]